METDKLRWVRQRQKELRAELYQGLQDALHTGENNAENVGRRTILPSSFVGSHRDMTQRYEDEMAIVLKEEICSSIKSIKYLYKYCYKGPDHVAMEVHRSSHYDEVKQFIDARWIAASEACWRIFRFNLYRMYHQLKGCKFICQINIK
ncbi:uncharacterized protein LOC130963225 [Arachis stenosperma]|uniref:uncharacterized protein LOC130963225 n=1 Tax=Arachis stenosperma TaxID=217475 RepID=UPI0025AD27F7|nr:uncharacterized protein LOC130963225 [Arachis stenosperma]